MSAGFAVISQEFYSDLNYLLIFLNQHSSIVIISFVIFIQRIKLKFYSNVYSAAIIHIFATFLHELAHFIVGFITNAKPTKFTIFPKKSGDYYIYGSVTLRNLTKYNAMPTAMAPLLMFYLSYWFDVNFFKYFEFTALSFLSFIFIMTLLIENAIPSSQDFKVMFSKPLGFAFYSFAGIAAYLLLNVV